MSVEAFIYFWILGAPIQGVPKVINKRTIAVDAERLRTLVETAVDAAFQKHRPAPRLLTSEEVMERVALKSYATLWTWVKEGKFPQPIAPQGNTFRSKVRWREADIVSWIETRPERSVSGELHLTRKPREKVAS